MEEVRLICTPFLATAVLFCLYGIWYIKRWQKKNPWYKQYYDETRLSPQEREYRQNELRKYNNLPFVICSSLFTCMVLMFMLLQRKMNGGWNYTTDWIYLIPLLLALIFAASGIKRK